MKKLEFGDMVRDNHGRICMVIEEVECPSQDWLDAQTDRTVKFAVDCRWLTLFPITGGAVVVPETHIKRLGYKVGHKASVTTLMELYENANGFAKETLLKKLVEAEFKEIEEVKTQS